MHACIPAAAKPNLDTLGGGDDELRGSAETWHQLVCVGVLGEEGEVVIEA
jgi:hypothetical protein